MNVDKIVQYCVYNDYPLFRSHIYKYRDQVKKIILYPSRHHGVVDFEAFAKQVIRETWVEREPIDYGVTDWRQGETEPCLKLSDAEWIWFSEQDFFVKDWDRFYRDVADAMKTYDMIGWWNPTNFPYIHPCCLFIKREMLEKTKKDFRAHSEINGADHFSMITRDVEALNGKILRLQDIGYTEWVDAFHLGGLTYPYQDFKGEDTIFGVKSPAAFYVYNYFSRQTQVDQSTDYFQLSFKIEKVLDKKFPTLDPEVSPWKEFYI